MRSTPARTCLVATLLALAATAGGQWVEDSVDVGDPWVGSLAYNSREDVVYGKCQLGQSRFAVDCETNELVMYHGLAWPRYIAYDSTDNKAYFSFTRDYADSVLVLDGERHVRMGAIGIPGAKMLLWDPVANLLCVSCDDEDRVTVVDCTADTVLCHIPVGRGPMKMFLNTRHHKLYVLDYDSDELSVIDLDLLQETTRFGVGGYPQSGYYSPALDKFYCDGHELVSVIDGASDEVVATIPLPPQSYARAMTGYDRTDLVMLGLDRNDTCWLATVDGNTDSIIQLTPIGRAPDAVFWSRATNLIYCTAGHQDAVTVVSGDGSRVVAELPVGDGPFAFAYSPVHNRLYVGHLNGHFVYVIRDATGGICEQPNLSRGRALSVWPNPFAERVSLQCAGRCTAAAGVYSTDGRLIRRIQPCDAGWWEWDGLGDQGSESSPGVYVVVIESDPAARAVVTKVR